MKRRNFLKAGALATLPLILKSCDWASEESNYSIKVLTDIHTGHLVFESMNYPVNEAGSLDYAIVGGGVAGLAAAYKLRDQDMMLFELSDDIGGTSSSSEHNGVSLCHGAHYDLAYPDNYGKDVLTVLKELDLIKFEPWKQSWSFKDRQHIISPRRESRCFAYGEFREEVLPKGEILERFNEIMATFEGKMVMPTTEIDSSLHYLNELTFLDFLKDKIELTDEYVRGLDYHMLDDWGGKTNEVSALAGIHYFACRPYETEVVDLFSPPEGNGYFVKKLAQNIPSSQLRKEHLVRRIQKESEGFSIEIVDIQAKSIKRFQAKNIIYAGQKHALKFIMPDQFELFKGTEYAPWLVLNFVIKHKRKKLGYWQNEMLVDDETFMGFVDSSLQSPAEDQQVFTAYYCLPPSSREDLRNVEANREVITEKTTSYLNNYFDDDISNDIEAVYIKVMGHAMPVPKPGYLFNNPNPKSLYPNMTFAGVDSGRLPLFFEAMDSGIQAARILLKRSGIS